MVDEEFARLVLRGAGRAKIQFRRFEAELREIAGKNAAIAVFAAAANARPADAVAVHANAGVALAENAGAAMTAFAVNTHMIPCVLAPADAPHAGRPLSEHTWRAESLHTRAAR